MSVLFPNGVVTATLTPLDRNLDPDHSAMVSHIKWLLTRGNDGITLMGTTGEANSFSVAERMKILDAVMEGGIDPAKLLVGTGCASIADTVALTRHAHINGIRNMLVLPPFYYKPVTDAGIETYFAMLLDKVGEGDIQIYLYHFPKLSGVPFSNPLIEKLIKRFPDNIVGMKDSGGDWSHMEEVLKSFPGFRLYAGSEKFLLPALRHGGAGCISASANLTSPDAARVFAAWKNGGGEMEQERLSLLRDALELYPAIGTLKYLFAKFTGNTEWLNVRPPNVIIAESEGAQVVSRLTELGWRGF